MHPLLEHLLTAFPEPKPLDALEEWWRQHVAVASRFERPVERAAAAGFAADRLGYAFASGYQEAGAAMFGRGPAGALCATESGGVQPRAIATRLEPEGDGYRLDGRKSYVTLGTFAQRLFVVARRGEQPDGRPALVLVAIDRRPGVSLVERPQTPFAPEIPHAELTLEAVRVEAAEVLRGDGYTRFLKPFRTVEDIHVLAALLGWLLQVGRRSGWPREILERLVASLVTFAALSESPPDSSAVHVALAGALADLAARIDAIEPLWERVEPLARERWERDRPLLQVASGARAARREAAWRRLGQ